RKGRSRLRARIGRARDFGCACCIGLCRFRADRTPQKPTHMGKRLLETIMERYSRSFVYRAQSLSGQSAVSQGSSVTATLVISSGRGLWDRLCASHHRGPAALKKLPSESAAGFSNIRHDDPNPECGGLLDAVQIAANPASAGEDFDMGGAAGDAIIWLCRCGV